MKKKGLKKVIAASTTVVATLSAGAVSANGVSQSSNSSSNNVVSSSSVVSKSTSNDNKVVLKSSSLSNSKSESKKVLSDLQSSSSVKSKTSSKKSSQATRLMKKSREAVKKGSMVDSVKATNDILLDDFNKWKDNDDLSYDANGAKIAYDSINTIAKNYDDGVYDNKEDRDFILKSVDNSLEDAKENLDTEMKYGSPEKQKMAQDVYNSWNNLKNLLTNGEASVSSSSSSKSSEASVSSSSSSKSSEASVSSSSSSKSSEASVSSSSSSKSSEASVSSSSSSKSSEANVSSSNHGNGIPNVSPEQSNDIVDTLQPKIDKIANDINKYGDTDNQDVLKALADAANAANEITDAVNNYIDGTATKEDTRNLINEFNKKIAELEKAIANEKNPIVKAILQDELDAYKSAVNTLELYMSDAGNAQNVSSHATSVKSDVSVNKNNKTSLVTTKKVDKNMKKISSNAAKGSVMPQTGENSNKVGILTGIGIAVTALAGVLSLRRRHH